MTMTNTQLLKCHQKGLLTSIESQRRFLLEKALAPHTCPNCGTSVSKIEASNIELDGFPVGEAADSGYVCTHCKAELHWCVSLFGGDFWMLEKAWQTMTREREAIA